MKQLKSDNFYLACTAYSCSIFEGEKSVNQFYSLGDFFFLIRFKNGDIYSHREVRVGNSP